MLKEITVYYTPYCPYCTMAFKLLDQLDQQYKSINLLEEPDKRKEMEEKSQRTSVPQIFFDNIHIGGFDDMNAMNQNGKLKALLEAS